MVIRIIDQQKKKLKKILLALLKDQDIKDEIKKIK